MRLVFSKSPVLQGFRNVTNSVVSKPATDATAGRGSPSPFPQPGQCEGFQSISTQRSRPLASPGESPRQLQVGVGTARTLAASHDGFHSQLRIWRTPSNSPAHARPRGANGRHSPWPTPVQSTMLDPALMAARLGISCRRGRTSAYSSREIAAFGLSCHLQPRQPHPITPCLPSTHPPPPPPPGGGGGGGRTGPATLGVLVVWSGRTSPHRVFSPPSM